MAKTKDARPKVFEDVRSWRRKLSRGDNAFPLCLPSNSIAPFVCIVFVPSQGVLEMDPQQSAAVGGFTVFTVRACLLLHGGDDPALVIYVSISRRLFPQRHTARHCSVTALEVFSLPPLREGYSSHHAAVMGGWSS